MIAVVTGDLDYEVQPGEMDCLVALALNLGVTTLRHGDCRGKFTRGDSRPLADRARWKLTDPGRAALVRLCHQQAEGRSA